MVSNDVPTVPTNLSNSIKRYQVNNYNSLGGVRDETSGRTGRHQMLTYAIEMVGCGYVKIGKTTDLMARINALQTSSPFEIKLLARFRGDVESMLHGALGSQRVRGEWFVLNDRAREVFAMLDQYELGERP